MNEEEFETQRLETHRKMILGLPELCNGLNLHDVILELESFKLYYLDVIKSKSVETYNQIIKDLEIVAKNKKGFKEVIEEAYGTEIIKIK